MTGALAIAQSTTLTIATGVITQASFYHIVAAETGVTDDLDTITPVTSTTYYPFIILKADTGDTITLKHGTGNISTSAGADIALSGDKSIWLFYNGTSWNDILNSAAGGGETNTMSNVGVAGVGVYKQKVGVDFEMKNINAGSAKITVTNDAGNNEIDIDVSEANLTLDNIGGTLSIANGGTGQTTQTAAFDALSPLTTKGDLVTHDGANNVREPVGANGTIKIADSGETNGWDDVLLGQQLIISSTISSDAASISLSSIPAGISTFAAWRLEMSGINSDRAAVFDNVLMVFNSDTTAANYDSTFTVVDGSSATHSEELGITSGVKLQNVSTGANSDSSMWGMVTATIFQPLSTGNYKHVMFDGGIASASTTEGRRAIGVGVWESTSAITSITLSPAAGTTFLIGDAGEPQALEVRLYGLY